MSGFKNNDGLIYYNFNPNHSLTPLTTNSMKVIFGGETKRIPEIKEFEELVKYTANIFNATQL
jgi:hypothetical protein